jgi:SAM-dependent methyltransferase
MTESQLRHAWDRHAQDWVAWAREPGHDSYWRFHRDAFLPLVPEPGSLTVELGCGEGRVSRDLAARGHHVLGLDASPTMARAATSHPGAASRTLVADAAHLPLAAGCADCVVAHMSLQDVDDPGSTVREVARVLRDGGRLVMAVVHPLNSAGRFLGEHGDPDRPFVIDESWYVPRRYVDAVERDGLPMTFHSTHRALQDHTEELADAGSVIERLREPTESDPASSWYRIPLFLHIRARLERRQGLPVVA